MLQLLKNPRKKAATSDLWYLKQKTHGFRKLLLKNHSITATMKY